MAHYIDFVGLNTFIYEPVGFDTQRQLGSIGQANAEVLTNLDGSPSNREISVNQNYIGSYTALIENGGTTFTIQTNKNGLFSHSLPTTASFFPALMLKRNGPYGFPSWKQTRISENPLSRRQKKENIFTFVKEPGQEVVMSNDGKLSTIRGKYGSIRRFDEVPVTSRYKPFAVGGASTTSEGVLERFELHASFANETNYFNNNEVNNYYNKRDKKSPQYQTITNFYLKGGLERDNSPIDVFEYFKYKECIYPPRIYQYKNYIRQRTNFSFPWRDNRLDRTEIINTNGFWEETGSSYSNGGAPQSIWPLDAYNEWDTFPDQGVVSGQGRWFHQYGWDPCMTSTNFEIFTSYGILQNSYTFGKSDFEGRLLFGDLDNFVKVGPQYNRKHTITISSSVVAPSGMTIEGINSGSSMGNMGASSLEGTGIPGGEAKWEAGSQSGLNPFYDSYDKYVDGVRQSGKDYSIIPEFRISDHVAEYQEKGSTEIDADIFSISGGVENIKKSSDRDFYKIYSTSEFMKHFGIVKKDHKEFVDPMSITLRCKAIKKFLPYEGFYPAQRSVDLVKQFHNSYKDFTAVSGAANAYGDVVQSPSMFQNLMVPVFAPGVFFNTIKSGVAVDYPLVDNNMSVSSSAGGFGNVEISSTDDFYIRNSNPSDFPPHYFDRRIPFEAIVEPEKYLAGARIYCNEPHINANNSGSVFWNGLGDNLYKLMAHNFVAETSNFFMKNDRHTTIVSKESSDPNVGMALKNTRYAMRVKMFKSTDSSTIPLTSGSRGFFGCPQHDSSMRETFTMYSRPSAFGPPQALSGNYTFGGVRQQFYGETGENYAFTPPYYYGEAWADISFVSKEARKYSFEEIIASSSVYYYRFMDIDGLDPIFKTLAINGSGSKFSEYDQNPEGQIAMNLDASVNLFSQQTDAANSVDPNSPSTRWVIQTKFETPMLNFNHLSASDSITLPNNASQSVPRGMWHQYGRLEDDPTKGIFLQVDDMPRDWVENFLEESPMPKSLADLCGFSTEAARLGEIADSKTVSEAIIAVPFIEQDGERFFFRIARNDVSRAFGSPQQQNRVGRSVLDMIQKLRKYVLPPQLDFMRNPQIDPFAMYVFEFRHTFTKQDLANMWQNLYPKIGQTFETAESTISHQLLAHELLGGGAVLDQNNELDTNAIGNEIPDRVRWMVFKVKQRAKINYYEKIYGREDKRLTEAAVSSQGRNVEVSYNWPYDFFSLVELAKIEAEVKFAKRAENPNRKPIEETIAIPRRDLPEIVRGNEKSELFEEAIAGNLPTPDDIPQPLQDGSDYIDPTLQSGIGRSVDAAIMQDIVRGRAMMEQLGPSLNNPYGNTPLGDMFYDIQMGFGPAGRVGGDNRAPEGEGLIFNASLMSSMFNVMARNQVAGSFAAVPEAGAAMMPMVDAYFVNEAFTEVQDVSANEAFVNTNLFVNLFGS